jgi:hypothetical protein
MMFIRVAPNTPDAVGLALAKYRVQRLIMNT